jgi:hypothetical protein
VFAGKFSPDLHLIKPKELTDHPVAIGGDPEGDSQVVGKFCPYAPGAPGDQPVPRAESHQPDHS